MRPAIPSRRRGAFALALTFALLAAACRPDSTPTPPPPTPIPATATAAPPRPTQPPPTQAPRIDLPFTPVAEGAISPKVIRQSPEPNEALAPDGAVELVFDRAMDPASVAAALVTQPRVDGALSWTGGRTAVFKPASPLPRGFTFDLGLSQRAKASDGAELREPFQMRVTTRGNLEVSQTIPDRDAQDVAPDTIVTVMFNRPVVPLTTLSLSGPQPAPLELDPPVAGKQEWLNTSVLAFKPAQPLPGGTRFTARVRADLKDVDGNPLAGEYVWSFSTNAPRVLSVTPDGQGGRRARVDTGVRVRFNQDVDPATAAAAFRLSAPGGAAIPGTTTVQSDTLLFTPTQRLAFDTAHAVRIDAGVKSASGGAGMRDAFASQFTTFPRPSIVRTTPADGTRDAPPYTSFSIVFSAPIDPATVMARLSMTPALSPTRVFTSYSTSTNTFVLSFGAQPATDYTVDIAPGIADPFGNVIERGLRVSFRTGNLPPNAYLTVQGNAATFDATRPARVVAVTNNVTRLDLALTAFDPRENDPTGYRDPSLPPPGRLIRQWQARITGDVNKVTRTAISLGDGDGRLAPGAYWLTMNSPDFPANQRQYRQTSMLVVVSPLNLVMKIEPKRALVWATDLRTGQAVPGARLTLYGARYAGNTRTLVELGQATTGADGVAVFNADTQGVVNHFALSESPYAMISQSWSAGVALPESGTSGSDVGSFLSAGLRGYLYTDRGIYRPSQTVYLKGVVRSEDDAQYALPPAGGTARLRVMNARGESVLDTAVRFDEAGGFDASLALPAGAALGTYRATVTIGNAFIASHTFDVAEYRPPEYEVAVTPSVTQVTRGSAFTAVVAAKYLSGGGLANAPVNWNIVATRETFNPPQLDRYSFSDNDNPWPIYPPFRVGGGALPPQPWLTGTGTTDPRGELLLTIPVGSEISMPRAGAAGRDYLTGTVRFSLEANASGADNQSIAGRAGVLVHPADRYVGVAMGQSLVRASEAVTAELVAVDWAGARLADQRIEASLVRREWRSTYDEARMIWANIAVDEVVEARLLTTDGRGEARASFNPPKAGSYRVAALIRDPAGRAQQSSRFVWVTGRDYVPWFRENNDQINLISDRTNYAQGDTAEILIPSPFEGEHLALITVERGHILHHEVIRMASNSQVYRLPIRAEHVPNVFVSVVVFKGGDDRTLADFKVGYVNLSVPPTRQRLTVSLAPNTPAAQPGETVTFTADVKDADGNPVAGSFSLDLVDKGILNLKPRTPDAIVRAFYGERPTNVRTSSALSVSGNRVLNRETEQVLGRGGGGEEAAPLGTAMPVPASAPREAAADAASAPPAEAQVRENFADTALWRPTITTDAAGRASLAIQLPDNLTTWVLRMVGADARTRVGEGVSDVVATKPLLIRPVAPRFLVVGDVIELGAIVNNNTDAPIDAIVTVRQSAGLSLTTPASVPVRVPPQGEATAAWRALTLDAPQVDLTFAVAGGGYADASKPRLSTAPNGGLRVNRYSAPEVVGTAGMLSEVGARTEVVALPPQIDTTQGALTVRLAPSLVAGVQAGLRYVETWPYESADAVMSSFLPNALTYAVLREFVARDAELEAKLRASVSDGLEKLYRMQNADGGWGWFRERESNAHTTLYVVFGLLRAKEAGFAVRQTSLDRGLGYARASLRAKESLRAPYDHNLQTYVLYVLGEGGRGEPARVAEMFELRDNLGVYGKALLALTIGRQNASDERLKTLFADVNGRVIQSATGAHWEERAPDPWAMNTDTRSTALVLMALARFDPRNALAPNAMRWLMSVRTDGGYWRSTFESAWVMISLVEWMRATGELKAEYEFGATLNGAEIARGAAAANTLTRTSTVVTPIASLLLDADNRLVVARGAGPGRLYYTAHLKAYLPVPSLKALDRGMQVFRRYTRADCADGLKCPAITSAKIGDVVRVELTVIAPNNLYYVQVEDPIPAGAEPVDTGLATTSQLAMGVTAARAAPARYGWWWSWYSRSELRDDRVALFARTLPRGTYEFAYSIRLTSPGEFNVIPAFANETYFPEVFGRSDGALFTVTR